MRRMLIGLTLLAAGLGWLAPAVVSAQALTGYNPVQLGPPIYPVVPYVTGTPGDAGTINKQLTVTITPPAGQYVYVHGWDWSYCQDAAASAAAVNVTFTSTGFTNLPKIAQLSLAVTNNICAVNVPSNFGSNPIKSATAGAAVTFVGPAANAHAANTLNVYAATGP